MKLFNLLIAAASILMVTKANAIICMGKGQKYTVVQCEITSTKTFEAGYTEEYGKARISLLNYDSEGVIIDMGLATGNVQARVSVQNSSSLKLEFNQNMGEWGRSVTLPVQFPAHICGGTNENALSTSVSYVADFQTYATNLNLNIECQSYSFFENEP